MKCPHCGSRKIDQLTPITDHKNKTKYFHTFCAECNKEMRIETDGTFSKEISHDKSWLDDLDQLIN